MGKKRADGEGTYVCEKRKNKDGSITEIWRFIVTVEGKRKAFSATGKGAKAAAKAKYEEWSQNKDKPQTLSHKTTLKEWMKLYLENCRKGTIKETSYHQLELLADDLTDNLKNKPIKDIAPIELQAFLNKFAQNASRSYVNKMTGLIKSAFAEAVENDLCAKNSTRKLKIPYVRQEPKKAFTLDEVRTICEFAKTYHQDIKQNTLAQKAGLLTGSAVITLLYTGLRRGELLGLMWSDIKTDRITVNRAVFLDTDTDGKQRPTVEEYQAKTENSIREIPLLPEVSEAINRLPKRGMFIYSSQSGGIMSPRNFNRSYDAFFKNLHNTYPEIPKLNIHECRHTFATLSQTAGADIRTVQMILGHEDIKTTAGYTHPDFESIRQASLAFSDAVKCNNRCNNQQKQASSNTHKA